MSTEYKFNLFHVDDIENVLTADLSKYSSKYLFPGSLVRDKKTNTLYVIDSELKLVEINGFQSEFDSFLNALNSWNS